MFSGLLRFSFVRMGSGDAAAATATAMVGHLGVIVMVRLGLTEIFELDDDNCLIVVLFTGSRRSSRPRIGDGKTFATRILGIIGLIS